VAFSIIALGANLPGRFASPADSLEAALSAVAGDGARLIARSRLYRSPAWPDPADPEFVNAAGLFETTLSPSALLIGLHGIEAAFGRTRLRPNAPRPLDLDIVDYAGLVSAPGETPVLPHPRLHERAFVLLPMAEIVPDWRHPVTGRSIGDLIASLPDRAAATPL
jgi:2-amino-4-hydroxy-6-hydroxymethyldihydropteridine diphosphokinase